MKLSAVQPQAPANSISRVTPTPAPEKMDASYTLNSLERRGLCLVMLGPDGVGKSTMRAQLLKQLGPRFSDSRSWHFRPRVIGRIGPGRPVKQPHLLKPRGKVASVLYLFTVFADYWLGYLLYIRPLLARRSLVVLDRYFQDICIDPVRYRYGGPMWLVRWMRHLVPPRDVLFLVLDADAELVYSRKRELAYDELIRQRGAYKAWALEQPNALIVRTDLGAEESSNEAIRSIMNYLRQRFPSSSANSQTPQSKSQISKEAGESIPHTL